LGLARGILPVSVADNTAQVSQIIDMQGKKSRCGYRGRLSCDADATFTVLVQHGDVSNLSDAQTLPSDMLNADLRRSRSFTFAGDDKVFKIGYRGDKRYVRYARTGRERLGRGRLRDRGF